MSQEKFSCWIRIERKETIMLSERKLLLVVGCLACTLVILPEGRGQKKTESKEGTVDTSKTFRVREGFQGPLTVKTKQGKVITLRVGVHTWSIDGTLGRQTIRLADFTLFQMRGGKIKALIDGKEGIKSADAFWTMPAGSTLTFEVKGETALLDATSVSTK
jgi:hypothetical protein